MEHFAGAAAGTALGALAGFLLRGETDCPDCPDCSKQLETVLDSLDSNKSCPVCPVCPVCRDHDYYCDVKTTNDDTHMQLGDISWRLGFNRTVFSDEFHLVMQDSRFHEKGNVNSTVIGNNPFVASLGNDTNNVFFDGRVGHLPELRCTSSVFQEDGELATGLIQCQVKYEGQEQEEQKQRNCFVNPREIASLNSHELGTISLNDFELLCPLKQYDNLDDWKSENMGP